MDFKRQYPNIIICGPPSVGKSRLCQELCSLNKSLRYVNINDLAKTNKYILDYDEDNQCDILDDDAIYDYFDKKYFEKYPSSGLIIDYHSAGIIPDNNQIHGVFVLRCIKDTLCERLKTRHYSEEKIQQIIQHELFHVCLNEARETFDEAMVYQLMNETETDLKTNVEYLLKWIDQWPFNEIVD